MLNRPIKIEVYASVNNAVKIINFIDILYRHYPLADTSLDDSNTWTATSEDEEALNTAVNKLKSLNKDLYSE